MRRRVIELTVAASLAASIAPGRSGASPEPAALVRPNVIFVLADDFGYADLGSYGQEKIRTPSIDRLAAEGVRFTQHYSGNAVCAPSRSVLMTGLGGVDVHLTQGPCASWSSGRREPALGARLARSAGRTGPCRRRPKRRWTLAISRAELGEARWRVTERQSGCR